MDQLIGSDLNILWVRLATAPVPFESPSAYRRRVSRRCIFVGRVNKQAARLSSSSPLRSARATPFPRYMERLASLGNARVRSCRFTRCVSRFFLCVVRSRVFIFPSIVLLSFLLPRLAFSTVPRRGKPTKLTRGLIFSRLVSVTIKRHGWLSIAAVFTCGFHGFQEFSVFRAPRTISSIDRAIRAMLSRRGVST